MGERRMKRVARGLVAFVVGLAGWCSMPCAPVWGHALDPALLNLEQAAGGEVQVTWKVPSLRVLGARLEPILPPSCQRIASGKAIDDGLSVTSRWRVRCTAGLVGQQLGVDGLGIGRTDALVRVRLADGRLFRAVVGARQPLVTVPERPRWTNVFRDYTRLGTEHILSGPDHLLFVFGLILLVGTTRLLLATITAFTVGHSVTLSLAALGATVFPQRPMEALIALTILVLAVELAREPDVPSRMRRYPWIMSLAFGLLHGFGFAGALRQVGLPDGEIGLALFSFNLGVEIGQLAFVLAVLTAREVLRRVSVGVPAPLARAPVYVMGSLAAMWCIERTAALLH